jgi:hypothetical protein
VGATFDLGSGMSLSTTIRGLQSVGVGSDKVSFSLTHTDPTGSTSMWLKME